MELSQKQNQTKQSKKVVSWMDMSNSAIEESFDLVPVVDQNNPEFLVDTV